MTATPQTPQATAAPGSGGGEIITVERPDGRIMAGQGMLKGMVQVIRHFGMSFVKNSDDKTDNIGMFNVQYPEERMALPEAFRNMPVLLYDDATGQELCTSCFQCERICPPKVIHITQASDPKTGKPVPAAEEFVIEYDTCMSCGLCAEVCPFDAIKMDHNYELSTPDHLGLDVHKAALNRPISYYKLIAPNMWADVQAQALKKLQNNVKRRSGNIGVAPHLWGKQLAAAAPVAGAARAAAAKPSAPVAAIGKSMSPEKVARLEAIRAAKRGGAAPGSAEGAPSAEAFRGADVPEQGTHVTESQADTPAQAVAATGPVAAVGANMSDEKKARLEAIRAAKRAQQGE